MKIRLLTYHSYEELWNSDINTDLNNSKKIFPNTVLINNSNYKKNYANFCNWKKKYFTIVPLESSCTFSFSVQVSYSYSTNNGSSWTNWATLNANTNTTSFNKNTLIRLKGNNLLSNTFNNHFITSNKKYKIYGNLLSLNESDISNPTFYTINTLPNHAFQNLFKYDTYLVDAKNLFLSFNTLSTNCYYGMFSGCTNLLYTPELLSQNLASYCYAYMFQTCTSLLIAPELPAITLANYCYAYMFQSCISLTTPPHKLPATTLSDFCYLYMFASCLTLTYAPNLIAEMSYQNVYDHMFYFCKSLYYPPKILSKNISAYGCNYMFHECTSLTDISTIFIKQEIENIENIIYIKKFGFDDIEDPAIYSFYKWSIALGYDHNEINNFSPHVVIDYVINNNNYTEIWHDHFQNIQWNNYTYSLWGLNEYGDDDYDAHGDYCYLLIDISNTNCNSVYDLLSVENLWDDDYTNIHSIYEYYQNIYFYILTQDHNDYSNISPHKYNKWITKIDSVNKTLKIDNYFNVSNTEINKRNGYTIYHLSNININDFKNHNNPYSDAINYLNGCWQQYISNYINNLNTKVNNNDCYKYKYIGKYLYNNYNYYLWEIQQSGIDSKYHYILTDSLIFYGKTLETNLLANYNQIKYILNEQFQEIITDKSDYFIIKQETQLEIYNFLDNSNIGIVYNNGCNSMFANCTSLVTAPIILPYTYINSGGYRHMFANCTSLINTPILPATSLGNWCYQNMFINCYNLKIAPDLLATYIGIKNISTGVNIELSDLCYDSMFENCKSLEYLYCNAENAKDNCFNQILNNVKNNGIFIGNSNTNINYIYIDNVPLSWMYINITPQLLFKDINILKLYLFDYDFKNFNDKNEAAEYYTDNDNTDELIDLWWDESNLTNNNVYVKYIANNFNSDLFDEYSICSINDEDYPPHKIILNDTEYYLFINTDGNYYILVESNIIENHLNEYALFYEDNEYNKLYNPNPLIFPCIYLTHDFNNYDKGYSNKLLITYIGVPINDDPIF